MFSTSTSLDNTHQVCDRATFIMNSCLPSRLAGARVTMLGPRAAEQPDKASAN